MSRILGRSRSLRMLKGGQKETHQRETDSATPQPTLSQADVERLKAASPVARADRRVETPDMLQRPKTSGGPGDRSTLFHKKVTPVHGESRGFEFALPSPTKSTTVLYAAEVEEREGVIGIALGSPSMASHWNTTPQATDFVTNNLGTFTQISSHNNSPKSFPQSIEAPQGTPKPKLSRWKSLFKKTAPPPPQREKDSFYQLAKSVAPARADSHHDNESLDSRSLVHQEDDPRSVSPPTFRPEIRESRKLPKAHPQAQPAVDTRPRALTMGVNPIGKPKPSLLRSASSPKPLAKDGFGDSPTVPRVVVSGGSHTTSPRTNGEKPLLDVDIPTVHMERYSVMFSGLLQGNSNRQSSLLQRRQGNSEKLKPLNELSVKNEEDGSHNRSLKPQRRATSPSFAPKSPGHLSLFPSANTSRAPSPRAVTVNRPRPLQRSKTAPAVSPHRQTFPKQTEDGAKDASQESKKGETLKPGTDAESRAATPSSDRSFDSDSEEITIVVAQGAPGQTWRPRPEEKEPEWEFVSKPTAITKMSALSSHPATQPSSAPLAPSRKRSETNLSPTPRSADRPAAERNPDNAPQATVGVARSLSVTRANRPELLRPTLSPGRFVDNKPLTPTLVELKNRKSQRVQLVDA